MAFKISYVKAGEEIAATSWPGTLENSIGVAVRRLNEGVAESATITDAAGKPVWSGSKN